MFTVYWIVLLLLFVAGFTPVIGAYCSENRSYPLCMLVLVLMQFPIMVSGFNLRYNNFYMVEENIPELEKATVYDVSARDLIKHMCCKKEGYHNDLTILTA